MRHRQPLAGDRASEYGKTLAEANHREGTMGDLEIVTTADRHDLDEQARDAFRPGWPEFIFHDPISAEHVGRVEAYFPQYDVLSWTRARSSPEAGGSRCAGTAQSAPCRTVTTAH